MTAETTQPTGMTHANDSSAVEAQTSTAHKCCIHIGLPKTATKALQSNLFARHDGLYYLGTYHEPEHLQYRKCRDAQVERLMNWLIFSRRQPDLRACRKLFEQIMHGVSPERVALWSFEALSMNRVKRRRAWAERLHQVFGPSKVIITLRHPLSLVESVYFQVIKRDNVEDGARWGRTPWYRDLDQWLETAFSRSRHNAPVNHLDYARTIQIYADVFGRESIHIKLFEQMIEDTGAFSRSVCESIGIDPKGCADLNMDQRRNTRWTQSQMDRLRSIQRSPVRSLQYRFASRARRMKMLGLDDSHTPAEDDKAEVVIPDYWRERICDLTRQGHQYLMETWNLPLDKYDYPV